MSLLTKSGGFLGPIATVLGYVMSGIFALLVAINIPNIGLAIILFTIVIYMIMLPLTYRQQKFSRMTPLMNPELNAIRDKYKGKQDQASMQRMNEETQMVYAKYGVNPAGSCVQLAIQMLILFPLYRVIMNIPAYVSQVKDVFTGLADQLLKTAGAQEYLTDIAKSIQAMTISKEFTQNTIIDTLYKFRPATWAGLAEKFPDLSDLITTTQQNIGKMNNFLGLDIANTPMNIIKEHAASTMKTMNNVMPLMSAFFCLTLPVGMGIYWIMSAVVRTVQQYFINKRLDKQDMTELLKKNMEKNKKKMEKKGGVTGAQISQNASINAKNIENQNQAQVRSSNRLERAKQLSKEAANVSDDAAQKSRNNLRPGSLAEKANMVSQYNETHRKK